MHFKPNPQQADPHDVFVIEPDVSLAARADKAPLDVLYDVLKDHSQPRSADIERLDIKPADIRLSNPASPESELRIAPDFSAGSEASPIPDVHDIKLGATDISAQQPASGKFARTAVMGLFALGSAICAAAWQHYGDEAKTMLAQWTPAFALASTPPAEKPAGAQAAVADQASAESASSLQAFANAVPAAAAAADPSPALQSMTRDLAAMGQQISELKATIEQLKANQAQGSQLQPTQAPVSPREPVRTEARLTEPTPPLVRPRIVMPPAHATTAPARKPKQVFPYAPIAPATSPAAAAAPASPAVAPAQMHAASPPQTAEDGGPVVRPPLPLH